MLRRKTTKVDKKQIQSKECIQYRQITSTKRVRIPKLCNTQDEVMSEPFVETIAQEAVQLQVYYYWLIKQTNKIHILQIFFLNLLGTHSYNGHTLSITILLS